MAKFSNKRSVFSKRLFKDYFYYLLFSRFLTFKGNPYDNAFAELFFKTLKQEEVYLWEYETFSDVIERIPYFIEDVYNRKRLHSSLGYRPPEEYERLLVKNDSQECIMDKTISV